MKPSHKRITKTTSAIMLALTMVLLCLGGTCSAAAATPLAAYEGSVIIDFTIDREKTIAIGEIDVIEPEFNPPGSSNPNITWRSTDESVATVTPEGIAGIVTGRSKGTTTIIAELKIGGNMITRQTELHVSSKGRDSILVLDISGSMSGTPMNEMKKAATQFCTDLLSDAYENRVGLVCYDSYVTSFSLTNDLGSLIREIDSLYDGSATNMEGGLAEAKLMMDTQGRVGAVKNIVLLTDGCPNEGLTSFSGSFRQTAGTWYDYDGYEYFNAVVDTAETIKQSYNLYSLGFFHSLMGETLSDAEELMRKIAKPDTVDRQYYYVVNRAEDLQFIFGDITETINLGSRITINIACPVDVSVDYKGERLNSARNGYNDSTSFGNLKLLGKNQDIKVVTLDSDKIYDIELTGTDTGVMDYSINFIDDFERIIDSRRFSNVPLTALTKMYSSTDNSAKISLRMDKTGSGIIDEILELGKNEELDYTNIIPVMPKSSGSSAAVPITIFVTLVLMALIVVMIVSTSNSKKKRGGYRPNSGPQWDYDPAANGVNRGPGIVVVPPGGGPVGPSYGNEAQAGAVTVLTGSQKGMRVSIRDGEVLNLGKDSRSAQMVLSGDYQHVSRLHCIITYSAQQRKYYVTDCSSNGTFKGDRTRLEQGKRVAIEANSTILLADENCMLMLE